MIVLLVSWLAAASPASSTGSHLQQGQTELNRGSYQTALKLFDQAIGETTDPKQVAQIHLLRGQVYGALRDLVEAEKAFEKALTADPEATLNPARVDPTLVNLLEGLRERMKGDLGVVTDPTAAQVTLDGNLLGTSPIQAHPGIGRHALAARSADGKLIASQSIVVFARRGTDVQLKLTPAAPAPDATAAVVPCPDPAAEANKTYPRPMADVRIGFDPTELSHGIIAEVGGGAEWAVLRAQMSLRIFPDFGVIPRAAVGVPITDAIHAYIEAELPFIFTSNVSVGVGASLGAEYTPTKWIGVFLQIGARYYFTGPLVDRVPIQGGLRLRLP